MWKIIILEKGRSPGGNENKQFGENLNSDETEISKRITIILVPKDRLKTKSSISPKDKGLNGFCQTNMVKSSKCDVKNS
jgi:hypothetical protein